MNRMNSAVSLRERFEKVCAAVAAAGIIGFVAIGTFAICGVGPMIA
jgi:hypothetical protein